MSTRAPGRPCAAAVLALLLGCAPAEDPVAPVTVVADPAESDIWVAELLDSGRRLRIGTPVNVTDRPGYDNQPAFLPDGSGFLYASIAASGQTDVWRYDLAREHASRVTRTEEAEYSPTPRPDGGFTVVRVELDGRQRVWQFGEDGTDPRLVLPHTEPVGYHAWLDEHRAGVFVLGEPTTLAIVDTRRAEGATLLSSIGRSLHKVPGRTTISVVHKAADNDWNIVEVDPDDGEVTHLAPLLRPAEDYAWLPDGQLIMGRGAKLYLLEPGEDREWRELADFTDHGIDQITRIAVSPASRRIAFVVQR